MTKGKEFLPLSPREVQLCHDYSEGTADPYRPFVGGREQWLYVCPKAPANAYRRAGNLQESNRWDGIFA